MDREHEECAECGFDGREWRVRDAATVFDALGTWWRLATDGVAIDVLNARPAPDVWSVLEYGVHSALVTAMLRWATAQMFTTDGVALPDPPSAPDAAETAPAVLDRQSVVGDLAREGAALARLAGDAVDGQWEHTGRWAEMEWSARRALVHAAHDATHHFMDAGRVLAALGAAPPAGAGTVVQVNASDGGVPKRPVAGGAVDHRGLTGDRQADRLHHGRPFQALCLWSADVIGELAAADHPIAAGCAGENLTVGGVRWDALRPGTRLRIGTVLAEVSYPAVPCAKQARWFTDGDFGRIAHERNPQWVRWYAWVREPGHVAPGDAVTVT